MESNNPLSGARVLVCGASSFIGSSLLRKLQLYGADIYGASRQPVTDFNGNFTPWTLDITQAADVQDTLRNIRPDYIFNLTGWVNGARAVENVWPTFRVNLEGTANLLMALQDYPCQRLLLIGSLDEYQPDPNRIQPVSPYAASKIAANAYARMFQMLYGTPVVIARPFMVYGPNQKDQQKLLPYTILSLLRGQPPNFSSGQRRADWVYVDDVAEGLIKTILHPGIEGRSVQLGTGCLNSVREVVEKVFELMDAGLAPQFGDVPDRKHETEVAADTEETKALIGWEAQTSLEEGLRKTIEWYSEKQIASGIRPGNRL